MYTINIRFLKAFNNAVHAGMVVKRYILPLAHYEDTHRYHGVLNHLQYLH